MFCHLNFGIWNSSLLAQDSKEEEALFVAEKAFGDGFYEVSLELLERFSKNYPNSSHQPQVELLIGQCYFYQNRFLDALNKFEELKNKPAAKKIKDASIYWIAEVHFKGNSFSRAASYYKEIIDNFTDSPYLPAAYYSLGWCMFEEGDFREALEYFRAVESKFPKEARKTDAAFKAIECLYNLKDYTGLKKEIGPYLKLYSKDPNRLSYLYFYLAEADYYLKDFHKAIQEYSRALADRPGRPQGQEDDNLEALVGLGIGWSYLKLKQYVKAEESFAGINPEKLEKSSRDVLLLGRAVLMIETGRANQAEKIYSELILGASAPLVLVQGYLGKAELLYSQGLYKEAISLYREALSEFESADIPAELLDKLHYNLAWAYLKDGEFKEAIKTFQSVAKESNDKIIKVSALCQVGDAYQDSGDYRRAQATYDSLLKDYPDSFYSDYVQYQLGITMLKSSNYDGAAMSFLALKRNYPQSKIMDDAAYALGLAYFQKQDYNSSREVFEKFEDEFKDSNLKPQALYLLGTSLYNLAEFEGSIEAFKKIVKLYTRDRELVQKAEYEIADCFYRMGDEKEAMKRFKALGARYPDSSLGQETMWWLGDYYYRHNDLPQARRYFSNLIQDFPQSNLRMDAYYALGSIYAQESRNDKAIESFKQAIELGKSDLAAQAGIAMADIYLKEDKADLALDIYQGIITEYPNLCGLIYPKMADFFAKETDFDQALEYYRRSLDVVPVRSMPAIQLKIAETMQAQGKTEEAIEAYLKTAYLYSSSEDQAFAVRSLLRVAEIYEGKENFQEALNVYAKVISMNTDEAKYAQERMEWIKKHVK
ncbi:MAG: tetratricopeptide repeat protein [Candidatus Omnitrophica bacterium]|nr:tetratricopeptide repeat protein [Candidatus Omnitrophota bacterium]